MTPEARISLAAPERFQGLDRYEARRQVVAELEAAGLLERVEEHRHAVGHCYRCDTVIEPRLSDQWFVRMEPLARPALAAYRDGTLRFVPERRGDDYTSWLEGIRDWCISRQLWWGHRIPVWYCDADGCGMTSVSRTDLTVCPGCGGPVRQDDDVLDTWFSSWLVPFSSLGWPEQTRDLATYYPGHTLVSSPDILFFWVARMIMSGLHFMGKVPYTRIYLHGVVRDTQHRKMSKSLGNGIDPLEVVERYGADALRYSLISGMSVGTDVILDPQDLESTFAPARNFANKLWNAGRFILSNLEGPTRPLAGPHAGVVRREELTLADRWIIARCDATVVEATEAYERFRLNEAAARGVSVHLERSRRLVHRAGEAPAVWRPAGRRRRPGGSGADLRRGAASAAPGDAVHHRGALAALPRPAGDRLDLGCSLAPPRPAGAGPRGAARLRAGAGADRGHSRHSGGVWRTAGPGGARRGERERPVHRRRRWSRSVPPSFGWPSSPPLSFAQNHERVGGHAVLSDRTSVFVPLGEAIDIGRECGRLGTEADRLLRLVESQEKKLGNEQFVSRAPAEVVDRERQKLTTWKEQARCW